MSTYLKLIFLVISLCLNAAWAGDGSCIGTVDEITKCAKDGRAASQDLLGDMYFYGNEVPRNYKESYKWHMLSAKQGYKAAQSSVGFAYYNGWGVNKNIVEAYVWFSLGSLMQNSPHDKIILEKLESEMSSVQLDKAQEIAKKCSESKFQNCN